MLVSLPNQVLVQILLNLPVKSLLRFKSVSREWKCIIESPYFIGVQLDLSRKNRESLIVAVPCYASANLNTIFCMTNLQDQEPNIIRQLNPVEKLHGNGYDAQCLGSCNGLMILGNVKGIWAWNPSTGMDTKLPRLPGKRKHNSEIAYGLGNDSIRKTGYKFVRIFSSINDQDVAKSEIHVFSFSTWNWKKCESSSKWYVFGSVQSRGVLAGNALHWQAFREYHISAESFILTFDLASETFKETSFPDFTKGTAGVCIHELQGRLVLSSLRGRLGTVMVIWLREDNGTWVKLTELAQEHFGDFILLQPLVYKEGERQILFRHGNDLSWFDLLKMNCTRVELNGLCQNFETIVCVESLIPPGGEARLKEISSKDDDSSGDAVAVMPDTGLNLKAATS